MSSGGLATEGDSANNACVNRNNGTLELDRIHVGSSAWYVRSSGQKRLFGEEIDVDTALVHLLRMVTDVLRHYMAVMSDSHA